ncbi:MAG TPA: choice-of-anchor I family protein [Cyclobacteriaceae bacterium]|nr:choice-of-anchor I family protein [Cyclobacteriaceae bacterium]
MKKPLLCLTLLAFFVASCSDDEPAIKEDYSSFEELGEITLPGGATAGEITAFDPSTNLLFTVNNAVGVSIDIWDLSDPATPEYIGSMDISALGGNVNSVAVSNGLLAAAVEGALKTDNGTIVVWNTKELEANFQATPVAQVEVGALPDMVTFSPDGKYILSANEGEPSDSYAIDPLGTVSIITVNGYSVTTLNFSGFNSQEAALESSGFRVFGPNATLDKDVEPEYITVSKDSKTAWVSLQENNGIATIDLTSKTINGIFPLGTKDWNASGNMLDPSNSDGGIAFVNAKVYGFYLPDAIGTFSMGGTNYVVSANEGDVREWAGYNEAKRINGISLDASAFPDGATLKLDAKLGRLNITTSIGDTGSDNDFDKLYAFGGRSFSIWDGTTGALVYDEQNLEADLIAVNSAQYDDGRSDDKGVEPEGLCVATVNGKTYAFVALERADAVMIYDITTPTAPEFLKMLTVGDAPEGIFLISAEDSPNGKSLLVVSSENDGKIKIFQPAL